jgi:hypothetical protein
MKKIRGVSIMRNLIIIIMMSCVLPMAYADTMDHFFESGSAWMDGIRHPKADDPPPQYQGSLGKVDRGIIYDKNGAFKGHVSGSDVFDQHNQYVPQGNFDKAVNDAIKQGN